MPLQYRGWRKWNSELYPGPRQLPASRARRGRRAAVEAYTAVQAPVWGWSSRVRLRLKGRARVSLSAFGNPSDPERAGGNRKISEFAVHVSYFSLLIELNIPTPVTFTHSLTSCPI